MQYNTKFALTQKVWFIIDGGDTTNVFIGLGRGTIVNIYFKSEYMRFKKVASQVIYKLETNKVYGENGDLKEIKEDLLFETIEQAVSWIVKQAQKKEIARDKYIQHMRGRPTGGYKKKLKVDTTTK